ncbi:MAG: hypothetical protein M3179_05780 [Actinomycetota bacterium]|nr:hypothetical protein [Actinomycetota bacterium]
MAVVHLEQQEQKPELPSGLRRAVIVIVFVVVAVAGMTVGIVDFSEAPDLSRSISAVIWFAAGVDALVARGLSL